MVNSSFKLPKNEAINANIEPNILDSIISDLEYKIYKTIKNIVFRKDIKSQKE
ncbi:hypothetical protein [Helicobacter sp. 16-1353]|uniref:hypothetical protein n=1 Tax=Helicobacter sp. 16-1353 TaxID=2004996 RepID=UPI0015EF1A54|nr:hypothetical protein [Helicobacter sp. 16-1353]